MPGTLITRPDTQAIQDFQVSRTACTAERTRPCPLPAAGSAAIRFGMPSGSAAAGSSSSGLNWRATLAADCAMMRLTFAGSAVLCTSVMDRCTPVRPMTTRFFLGFIQPSPPPATDSPSLELIGRFHPSNSQKYPKLMPKGIRHRGVYVQESPVPCWE